ncbi:MAG: DUF927 domain-containing protein [Planctomycetes bacterium]|nr:DUF927 domain-containing protein [Planctomycetota bacterium]
MVSEDYKKVMEAIKALPESSAESVQDVRALLQQVAALSGIEEAQCLKALKARTGHPVRSLRQELKQIRSGLRAAEKGRTACVTSPENQYRVLNDTILCTLSHRENSQEVQLANFDARIQSEIEFKDDQGVRRVLELKVKIGGATRDVRVSVEDFESMAWVLTDLGATANISAIPNAKSHLRSAIQQLSGRVEKTICYAHTGWEKRMDGSWIYLHGGGAIASGVNLPHIKVELPESLTGLVLPDPPNDEQLLDAWKGASEFLSVAPDAITLPLLAFAARAPLGNLDFSLFLVGPSGAHKSSLAAILLSFWGSTGALNSLQHSWSSTTNALETIAFSAKDALLVIDDFAPSGTKSEIAAYHKNAERMLRSVGNQVGRSRLDSEANLRKTRWPRCSLVVTAEDKPSMSSIRARLVVVEMERNMVDLARLTACQAAAREGKFATILSAYVSCLAADYDSIHSKRLSRVAEIQRRVSEEKSHARLDHNYAELIFGLDLFLEFLVSRKCIDERTRVSLKSRAEESLHALATDQSASIEQASDAERFRSLLQSALRSGSCHIRTIEGATPENALALGWERDPSSSMGDTLRTRGNCVGWVEESDLYLDLNAALSVAQRMAGDVDRIGATVNTLAKRLAERGYLLVPETNKNRLQSRKCIAGKRQSLYRFKLDFVYESESDEASGADADPRSERNGEVTLESDRFDAWVSSTQRELVPASDPHDEYDH